MRCEQLGLRKSKIEVIFISHLHGDHYFGLVGLLTSYQLLQRNRPLTIFGPPGLKEIISLQLKEAMDVLSFNLCFVETRMEDSYLLYEDEDVVVHTLPLDHRIHCTGFLFSEKKRQKKMKKEKIEEYQIPISQIPLIKDGQDFITSSGQIIPNDEITLPPRNPRKYAYCSDTAYLDSLIPSLAGVDLLYHEATFMDESIERAFFTKHSTARQAATIAANANVKKLIIGHFSAKYSDLHPLLEEAISVFANTELALEGRIFEIP